MVGNNSTTTAFGKTICSICYEDLKPIIEDLQSISICGHVFHEICLQQWFEYCTNGKKKNCPVCKQTCSDTNVGRLYFQSIGDSNDPSLTQNAVDYWESPEELRNEVKRLEGKVLGLTSALEQLQNSFEAVNSELCVCKEKLKVEVALKNEALKQKASIQQLMHLKSEELDQSTLEVMRLQERNMALAKELAALKLVSDLNLEEDEVLKLACLGNEVNSKETIEVLKKSLVIRNKSYKELMIKCNVLGRGEARSLSKLEKAKEKITKLKEKIQELESLAEVKDNEALRALKASRKSTCAMDKLTNGFDQGSRDQNRKPVLDAEISISENSSCLLNKGKLNFSGATNNRFTTDNAVPRKINPDNQEKYDSMLNQVENVRKTFLPALSCGQLKPLAENGVAAWKSISNTGDKGSGTQAKGQTNMDKVSDAVRATKSNTENKAALMDNDVILLNDDMELPQTLPNVRKDTALPVAVSQPGDRCFSGGLLGPDGTNWHLGKWCKRNKGQASLSLGLQGSNASPADLIAVGADGRGGRIKVLRSLDQSVLDNKETLTSTKKCKVGAKPSTMQSHGCLQIEHFFGRASQ